MSNRLWSTLKGTLASSVLVANAIAVCSGMIPFALLKVALPFGAVRRGTDRILNALAEGWIAVNGWWMAGVERIRWDVTGLDGLRRRGWYRDGPLDIALFASFMLAPLLGACAWLAVRPPLPAVAPPSSPTTDQSSSEQPPPE